MYLDVDTAECRETVFGAERREAVLGFRVSMYLDVDTAECRETVFGAERRETVFILERMTQ